MASLLTGNHTQPSADPIDFAPPLLRIRDKPPAPLAGWLLRILLALLVCLFLWAAFGPLDIVAVTDGKLVPGGYLKIVQPAEQGIVKEILVREGEAVKEGQVLIRMDAVLTGADFKAIQAEYHNKRLGLKRIEAQLNGKQLIRAKDDPPGQFAQVDAQHRANVQAFESALLQEKSVLDKARNDLAAASETQAKLAQVLPHYVEQEKAFDKLAKDGFAGRIMAADKARERIEREQDLRTQKFIIRSNEALIAQSEQKIAQIRADYRRQLQTEQVDIAAQFDKAHQELTKHEHRHRLLELRAPQSGEVKDLATHTVGTVASPGTILMTLVPQNEPLRAEVWVSNEDVGFVRPGQGVKLKLATFQFQKYGMLEGTVRRVSADSSEGQAGAARPEAGRDRPSTPLPYRAIVELKHQFLLSDGAKYPLAPGMQVAAEIHIGTRTVLEYLLMPLKKVTHEAARER